MTSPTRAEMKATLLAGWKEYWPVFITLLFTYLGWLALCRDDGYFLQAIGAIGVIILVLPGFPWVTPVRNWPGRGLDRHRRSRWLS